MKQNKMTIEKKEEGCKPDCKGCTDCAAVLEESRSNKPAGRFDTMQLYSSEALSYYFYFLPTLHRALGGAV